MRPSFKTTFWFDDSAPRCPTVHHLPITSRSSASFFGRPQLCAGPACRPPLIVLLASLPFSPGMQGSAACLISNRARKVAESRKLPATLVQSLIERVVELKGPSGFLLLVRHACDSTAAVISHAFVHTLAHCAYAQHANLLDPNMEATYNANSI